MSTIRQDQLEVASKFMTIFWKEVVKPFYNPENTEEWWGMLIDRMGKLNQEYCPNDIRLRKMMIGFFNGLNEVYKSEYSNRQTGQELHDL